MWTQGHGDRHLRGDPMLPHPCRPTPQPSTIVPGMYSWGTLYTNIIGLKKRLRLLRGRVHQTDLSNIHEKARSKVPSAQA